MKHRLCRIHCLRDLMAAGVFLAACNLLFSGCHLIIPFTVAETNRMQCRGTIKEYGIMPNGQPGFGVAKGGGKPLSQKYWKPFKPGVALYSSNPWKPVGSFYATMKGGYLLQMHRDDRTEKQDPLKPAKPYLLKLELNGQAVDQIAIAFDERATSVPDWLKKDFDHSPNVPDLPTSIPDKAGKLISFDVWEPKDLNKLLQQDLLLGGNNAEGATWPGNVVGEQYLVLVRMKVGLDMDPKKISELEKNVLIEYCTSSCSSSAVPGPAEKQVAIKRTFDEWVKSKSPKYDDSEKLGRLFLWQEDSTCDCVEEIVMGSLCQKVTAGDGTDKFINSWVRSSIGAIDSSSSNLTIDVINAESGAIRGTGVSKLSGEIEFRIDTESNVQIGELTMYGKDVTLSDGTHLSKISIGQDATIIANCNDSLPPGPFRLCNDYLVPDLPEPGFKASAFSYVNGKKLPVVLENTNPMPLVVDVNAMTFLMVGGPLEGSFNLNGDDYLVRIRIDMGGHFTSLAPVASVGETEVSWPCGESGIADVVLDAVTSDDDLSPGSVIGYKWLEDEGALTESVLGTSRMITVPMVFGIHDLTLKVQDTDAVWSSLDFKVDVYDPKIDTMNPPSEIWRLIPSGSGGASVSVGNATGQDVCSGQVRITNDAAPNGWYPSGLSVVTWRFDDYNGNIVDHPQKIFLLEPEFYPPPFSMAFVLADHVGFGQVQQISHETQPQGLAVALDEYVVLYGPNDFVGSIVSGEILHGEIRANATDITFGIEPFFENVFEGVFSEYLSEPGLYTVETSLVKPGGDPREPADVVARDWSSFTFGDER